MTKARVRGRSSKRWAAWGQSHLWLPVGYAAPAVMQLRLRTEGWTFGNSGYPGFGWEMLEPYLAVRLLKQITEGAVNRLVLVGGSTDVALGATGWETLDRAIAVADAWRDHGGDEVIACTIPAAAAVFGATEDAHRQVHNVAMMNSSAFDAVVDLHSAPFDDSTDLEWWDPDETHVNVKGAREMAARILEVFDAVEAGTYTPPDVPAAPTLTGGTAVDAQDDEGRWWRTLTFTSSSTLTLVDPDGTGVGVEAEAVVVDGGAAGGGPGGTVNRFGGGGAGGNVETWEGIITASQAVTVGAAGQPDATPTSSPAQGGDGTASSLGELAAGGVAGGGGDGGATASANHGRPGINGGGGGAVTVAGTGGASTGGGFAGGNGFASGTANLRSGGGGGGAGGPGGNGASADGGDGGVGVEWPAGSGDFYGGGGGGAAGSGSAGQGGSGVGGAGALGTSASGTPGTANTGGGGGGCAGTGTPGAGGTGGVKVRFRIYP